VKTEERTMSDSSDTGMGYDHEPIPTIPFESDDEARAQADGGPQPVRAMYIALAVVFVGIVGGALLATVFQGAWR
jgi:hypothetical protein